MNDTATFELEATHETASGAAVRSSDLLAGRDSWRSVYDTNDEILAAIKHLLRCRFDREIESAQLVLDACLISETEKREP